MFSYKPNIFANSVFDEVDLNGISIRFRGRLGKLKEILDCPKGSLEYLKTRFHPGYATIPITNKIAARTCHSSIKYPEKCNLIKHSIMYHLTKGVQSQ